MPQNINKADEEISLHPTAGNQTRFYTTLARPIVGHLCLYKHTVYVADDRFPSV